MYCGSYVNSIQEKPFRLQFYTAVYVMISHVISGSLSMERSCSHGDESSIS